MAHGDLEDAVIQSFSPAGRSFARMVARAGAAEDAVTGERVAGMVVGIFSSHRPQGLEEKIGDVARRVLDSLDGMGHPRPALEHAWRLLSDPARGSAIERFLEARVPGAPPPPRPPVPVAIESRYANTASSPAPE